MIFSTTRSSFLPEAFTFLDPEEEDPKSREWLFRTEFNSSESTAESFLSNSDATTTCISIRYRPRETKVCPITKRGGLKNTSKKSGKKKERKMNKNKKKTRNETSRTYWNKKQPQNDHHIHETNPYSRDQSMQHTGLTARGVFSDSGELDSNDIFTMEESWAPQRRIKSKRKDCEQSTQQK